MFRVFSKATATRINTIHCNPGNRSTRFFITVRLYSKKHDQCPPPTPKPGGSSGTLLSIGAIAIASAATLGYAKHDPSFRSWLKDTVPITDDVIKVVFMEESSLLDNINAAIDYIKGLMGSPSQPYRQPKEITSDSKPYTAPSPVFPKIVNGLKPADDYTEVRLETAAGPNKLSVEIVGDIKPPEIKLPVDMIAELEQQIVQDATAAVEAYKQSVLLLRRYNSDVEVIVEESTERVDPTIWNTLKEKSKEKDQAIQQAHHSGKSALSSLNKLKDLLRSRDLNVPDLLKERTKINMQRMQDDINDAKNELEDQLKLSNITDKYWDKVAVARKHFSTELEALFPTIDFEKKDVTINNADMDLFVLHAMSKVLFYQKELSKLETLSDQKLTTALESARRTGNYEVLTMAQICAEIEKERRKLELDYNSKCLKLRQESESELRNKLKLQSEAFSDHLEDAVKTRQMEMERSLSRNYDEQLTEERCKYKLQVSAMVGRLRGLEEAMKARMSADKTAQRSQHLWNACQALYKSVKAGCPGVPWMDQLRPLKPEILGVKGAADETDELVRVVTEGIPTEAMNRGVFPEDALRERFLKVEKVARKLALISEEGGRLHIYFLSYLQSLLLVKDTSPIPQAELNDEQVDFSKLSTNEILQRARYWLDRGDFAQTLRYMNLLKGAPRAVAKQWMNETRILLETQQAANTLMAYAAASGLMYF